MNSPLDYPWKGFVFLDVDDALLQQKHDLGFGLTLRKAELEELGNQFIKSSFASWSERRGSSAMLNQRTLHTKLSNGGSSRSYLQDPKDWRHAVIECSDPKVYFWRVNLAFSISDADLRMGYICLGNTASSAPYIEFPMLNVRSSLGETIVDYRLPSLDDLPEIRQNISYVLSNMTTEFPSEILEVIYMFTTLDNLPDSSKFKLLGYFSVIEGLLSHPPQNSDRMDSIQRQLVRNIQLLNNRLKKIDREIVFSDFGEAKPEKVLAKFYACRSAVSHGNNVDSSLDDINKIRKGSSKTDILWVHDWLRAMTKKLILAAIIEPELVSDLK